MTDPRDAMKAAVEALEFIAEREDFTFAECSLAEEICDRARSALSLLRAALEAREPINMAVIKALAQNYGQACHDAKSAAAMDSALNALLSAVASPVAAPVEVRPVAWMHEFTDPHTGERVRQPRKNKPTDYEVLPGEVVSPLYASPVAADTQGDALGYATRLAESLWRKHYQKDVPDWKPLPDLLGVLTQIDNIAAGLIRPRNAAAIDAAMKEPPSSVSPLGPGEDEYLSWVKELERGRVDGAEPTEGARR